MCCEKSCVIGATWCVTREEQSHLFLCGMVPVLGHNKAQFTPRRVHFLPQIRLKNEFDLSVTLTFDFETPKVNHL